MSESRKVFWNTCPLNLDSYPKSPCPLGKKSAGDSSSSKGSHLGCQWFVNSEEDHYCFWSWIRRNSSADGSLPFISQQEMAILLNCSISKLNQEFKEAMLELKKSKHFKDLEEYFKSQG